jgi:hypothetical protein
MGHWGWRPLVISTLVSVWVAGCNLISESASSTQPPTQYPQVTLTVGRIASPRASPPLTPAATLIASLPSSESAFNVAVSSFTCYPAQLNSTVCLGHLTNMGDTSLGRVQLHALLYTAPQSPPTVERISVDQDVIFPNEIAPFRATFRVNFAAYSGSDVRVSELPPLDVAYLPLTVDSSRLTYDADTAHAYVTAQVINSYDHAVTVHRAVITLLTPEQDVIGYQVLSPVDVRLNSGDSYTLTTSLPAFSIAAGITPYAVITVQGVV